MADAPTPKRKGRVSKSGPAEPRPKRIVPKSSIGDLLLNSKGMAALLGMKNSWFHDLVKQGVLPKVRMATYDPTEVVQAYIAHLKETKAKEKAEKPSSLDTVRDLKARELEVKLKLKERELIELDEAMAAIEEATGQFVAYLSGLPAEISRNVEERQRVDEIIEVGKQRLSDRFEQIAGSLASGGSSRSTEAED